MFICDLPKAEKLRMLPLELEVFLAVADVAVFAIFADLPCCRIAAKEQNEQKYIGYFYNQLFYCL